MTEPPSSQTAAVRTLSAKGYGRKREDTKWWRYPSTLKVSCLKAPSHGPTPSLPRSPHALGTVASASQPRSSNAHFRLWTLVGGAPTSCDGALGPGRSLGAEQRAQDAPSCGLSHCLGHLSHPSIFSSFPSAARILF